MTTTEPSPLPDVARALLEEILRRDVPGAQALRAQAATVLARPGCTCGCGTLELVVTDQEAPLADVTVPFEGEVHDDAGRPVGGLLLFVDDGRLSSLEVFAYGDDALPLPPPERVTW